MKKKVGMISLGCDKNRVDSENVLYSFDKAGYSIVNNAAEADILIVNTCAFIEAAKKESIDAILEMADVKKQSDAPKKLIVIGCMAERYAEELKLSIPEADVFAGINTYHNIVSIVENEAGVVKAEKYTSYDKGRIITTPAHYAYLKIADGCDNFCTYCAIPYIRGRYISYPMEELIAEARRLYADGVKELIIVAQDTTKYGTDLYGENKLIELLKSVCGIGFLRVRLMYAYPELIGKELVEFISTEPAMCKYLDVPIQHVDDGVLKRMNRRTSGADIGNLLNLIKSIDPDIAVRSSFIVGFPGESEEEFDNLKEFIKKGLIDYAGFFAYSREEGTRAYKLPGQLPEKVKKQRLKTLSVLQSEVIEKKHAAYIGKVIKVIYEGIDYDKQIFYGRNEQNAPDIDTLVYFRSDFSLEIGEIYDVKITGTGFNLYGETV